MKLIKQLETHRNHTMARAVTYHNVSFPNGFSNFLTALCLEGLISHDAKRTIVANNHRWADSIDNGGILIETTEHPLVKKNYAGNLTVVGGKDKLELFEALMVGHDVEHDGMTKPEEVQMQFQYHDTLNPQFWDGNTLREDVQQKLTEAADAFIRSLKIEDLDVKDIVLTGSNANYNWTDTSDVDLHVIVDFAEVEAAHGDLAKDYFEAKKKVFNDVHHITMHGHDVEFYIQDDKEKHTSSGMWSLKNNDWKMEPEHKEPSVDDAAVRAKTAEMMTAIDAVTGSGNKAAAVEALMEKLKKMRQSGLDEAGEFSVENLVFKQLRHGGYLEKLAKCKTKSFDRELSIEDEEWAHMC